jgi:hypothetical protein
LLRRGGENDDVFLSDRTAGLSPFSVSQRTVYFFYEPAQSPHFINDLSTYTQRPAQPSRTRRLIAEHQISGDLPVFNAALHTKM